MTNTSMLQQAIKDSGLKISFISRTIGLSRTGFYKKLSNESSFNAEEIKKLCELLEITDLKMKEAIFFAS